MVVLESRRRDSEKDVRYQIVSIGEKIKYSRTLSWKRKYGRGVTENTKFIRNLENVNKSRSIFKQKSLSLDVADSKSINEFKK